MKGIVCMICMVIVLVAISSIPSVLSGETELDANDDTTCELVSNNAYCGRNLYGFFRQCKPREDMPCFFPLWDFLFNFNYPGRSDPFFTMQQLGDFGQTAYGLSSADFNDDSRLDFAVSWATAPLTKSCITIFYNQGENEFSNETVFQGPEICYIKDLDAADYDNDGDIDLFFTYNEVENSIYTNGSGYILWNDGTNQFSDASLIFTHYPFEEGIELIKRVNPQLTSADYDDDGDIDFLVGDNSGLVSFYRNEGNRQFNCVNTFDFLELTWGLASADFDNDGDIDFIVASYNKSKIYEDEPWIAVFLMHNDGSVSCFNNDDVTKIGFYPTNLSYAASYGGTFTMSLHSIDYNNDGLMDFIAGGHGNVMLYMQQEGKQLFEPFTAARLPAPNCGPWSWRPEDLDLGGLTTGDFNDDGYDDVVVGGVQGFVRLLTNQFSLVDIVQPDRASVYVDDEVRVWTIPLYSFLKYGTSIVIGDLTVRTKELEPLSKVEFYLDNKAVFTDEQSPFEWRWTRFSLGWHTVKAKAFDLEGNSAGFDEAIVWKFL
ncbi:MAG: FG-GAP-like repeat-containing protein [Candidatus Thermoplasmatota archaeon]|nr:FG-GAP-like repeat-containing protein [Candidatus Thermoplasmatota archaeon]